MSENKDKLTEISSTLMQLFVSDVLSKNKVDKESRRQLTDEQKEKLRSVVFDLQTRVDEFLTNPAKKVTEDAKETEDAPKNKTLREMLQKNTEDN
ncbi:hypothetical protein LRR81_12140 [Metabacillus sp. GX 13764]|uniref:hypothetical protein n=1 Tax=Metabacillus kandeliae TaxID=2900151 RepID=UPI001E4B9E3F|nr:hypothetical protein [Metabacillus kandeliae]MCD7034999.1 hypothetical protein [Metabacillus kandeliae]